MILYECDSGCNIKKCALRKTCNKVHVKEVVEIYDHRFIIIHKGGMFCLWKCNKCSWQIFLSEGRVEFAYPSKPKWIHTQYVPDCQQYRLRSLLL